MCALLCVFVCWAHYKSQHRAYVGICYICCRDRRFIALYRSMCRAWVSHRAIQHTRYICKLHRMYDTRSLPTLTHCMVCVCVHIDPNKSFDKWLISMDVIHICLRARARTPHLSTRAKWGEGRRGRRVTHTNTHTQEFVWARVCNISVIKLYFRMGDVCVGLFWRVALFSSRLN